MTKEAIKEVLYEFMSREFSKDYDFLKLPLTLDEIKYLTTIHHYLSELEIRSMFLKISYVLPIKDVDSFIEVNKYQTILKVVHNIHKQLKNI